MSEMGVRRAKAALSNGCKSHPATAPTGSNRSSHGRRETRILSQAPTAFPLKVNAVLRAMTNEPLIRDKSVVRLSVMPSTKYSCSGSPLRLANGSFGELLQDWHFLGLTFIGGLGISSFFAFLSTSSFVYIGHYGLTPTQYSMAFSINAIGFIGASQFAGFLGGRFGMGRMVMAAVSAYASFAVLLLALTLAGFDSLRVLIPLLFVSFAFLGLVIPSTMVLSLENHGRIAGIASALGGTLQMVAGAIITGIAGLFFDGTSLPMVATVAAASVAALVLSLVTLRKKELKPGAAGSGTG
jgi:DHA1 family bicyclomycin/chloramphenicol resistance-like MFS transporter